MMRNYALELETKYLPYAIFDDENNIVGFAENTPREALDAAKEHIEMSKKFDDVTNYDYWNDLLEQLQLVFSKEKEENSDIL